MHSYKRLQAGYIESEKKYGPLPARYAGLGVYSDSLRPLNVRKFMVFDEGTDSPTYMLTTSDRGIGGLSFMRDDLMSLLNHGLVRIQSNDPGELSVYFNDRFNKFTRSHHSR